MYKKFSTEKHIIYRVSQKFLRFLLIEIFYPKQLENNNNNRKWLFIFKIAAICLDALS